MNSLKNIAGLITTAFFFHSTTDFRPDSYRVQTSVFFLWSSDFRLQTFLS